MSSSKNVLNKKVFNFEFNKELNAYCLSFNNDIENINLLENEKKFLELYLDNVDCEIDRVKGELLIKTDVNLTCLKEFDCKNNFDLFLKIAISISKKLSSLHKNKILYANISIDNIYLDENFNTYFFNFQNSVEYNNTALSSIYFKNVPLQNKSPEQLGRINNEVDFRSDIFSLGLVFYQLLKGSHPFYSEDELDIFHLILTKNIDKIENIPLNMSNIIIKMLKKEISQRYQSASGLHSDLVEIQKNIHHLITLGKKDISTILQYPQKVYGRQEELEYLINKFNYTTLGEKQTVFIGGYSGVGKSSLISEFRNKIISSQGYFISSKFDQYNQNLPYYAISESFNLLINQLLAKKEEELESLKEQLLLNLLGNGKILTDLIPDLEKLIGKQNDVEKLPANESENRFNQVFLNFIKTIAKKDSPLVLVVDDLQWMDLATLKLLEVFINSEELKYVFILCAYRDNELKNNFALKNIIDSNKNIQTYKLKSLKKDFLEEFLKDILFLKSKELNDLVEEVYLKTNANPFFFRQFIKRLYLEGFIYFDFDKSKWFYRIDKIKAENITDNVASFMLKSISTLDKDSLSLLQIASCIGASFDFKLIEKIESKPLDFLVEKMKEIFDIGFLIPLEVNINNKLELKKSKEIKIKFLHDQVQQAVYSTIDAKGLLQLHFKIGKVLLENKKGDLNYFEILNHLNYSKELLKQKDEKFELIELNIEASALAKKSTAYDSSLNYLSIAKTLLEEFSLKENYRVYVDLYLDYVELLYLTSSVTEAQTHTEKLFTIIDNKNDEILLRRILTVQYTRIGKLNEATNEALKSLSLLGMNISKETSMEDIQREIIEVQSLIKNMPFEQIVKLPKIKDEKILKTLDILMEMQPCTYNSGSLIFPLTILLLLKLTIKYGNSYLSYYIYMMYALMNTKVLKDYDMAFEASKYAIQIQKEYPKSILTGRVNMMLANFIMPWENKIVESSKLREDAYKQCLEYGDFYWGIHSYIFGFYANLLTCNNIEELYNQTKNIANVSKNINQQSQYYLCNIQMNLLDVLRGKLNNQKDLNHKEGFEDTVLKEYDEQNYMCGKYDFIIARLLQGFIFGNYKEALEVSLSKDLDETSLDEGIFHEAFYRVFNILSILKLFIDDVVIDIETKSRYQEYLDTNLSFIEIWKKNSPSIFLSISSLINALKAQMDKNIEKSIDYFEESICFAKENNLTLILAIANEMYGSLWLKRGNKKISDLYFNEAIDVYKKFHLFAKVDVLEKYLENKKTFTEQSSLDLNAIIKSSNIISKEINLEKLVKNILNIVFKLSAAQNAYLLINKKDEFVLASKISNDVFRYCLDEKQDSDSFPNSIINYAKRAKKILVINDCSNNEINFSDEYLSKNNPQSLLAIPLVLNDKVKSIIYLDSLEQKNIFLDENIKTLELLGSQIVISIENSILYNNLEVLVENRTKELEETLSLFDRGQILLFKWQNKENWPVSYLSNNIESILGYKREEFLTNEINYSELIHKDDLLTVIDEVSQATKNKEKVVSHKIYRVRHKDGKYIWIYDSTKIIYNDKNEVSYYLGYIVDVSKEKEREQYLQQQTKMVALGEMIGNIAHQWRQPLSMISTSISSLKLKKDLEIIDDKDIPNVTEIILNTVNDLSKTIDDFRDFLNVNKSSFGEYSLLDIVNKAQKMINHFFINYNIELIKDIDKNIKISCSENQLVQVFINLLSNSKDALLLCEDENRDKIIYVRAFKEKNKIRIYLKDNAGGIEDNVIKKVFEPYFTTKHQSQGKGLGLYLSHQIIVNELSGNIEVLNEEFELNSRTYKGASFYIEINE